MRIRIQFVDVPICCPSSGGGDGSGGETNPFCDRRVCKAVIPPCFVRKPEKGKENDCADDGEVTTRLKAGDQPLVLLPHNRRDLFDRTKVGVGIAPAHVRRQRTHGHIVIYDPACQRNGTEDFNAGESHEAEIPAGTQVPIGRKELFELCSSDGEFTNSPDYKMRLAQYHNTS